MTLVFVENHDSFSFTLVDYLKRISTQVLVKDHSEKPCLDTASCLVLGPGPGTPNDSSRLMQWLEQGVQKKIPILGVCLGHQAIGVYFGASLVKAPRAIHGEAHWVKHSGQGLFHQISQPAQFTRYHSLVLQDLPDSLVASAQSEDGQIMAIQHREKPIFGVQFHPESFLSPEGFRLLQNFCSFVQCPQTVLRSTSKSISGTTHI
ncbi:MAG: aminodeoxychorismate/anthranilate synthase component II [Myxococcaceae bacterium]|nr:aminodeoxychorismate/anthranilate synthase component II [Myxococcaceae bacterium]MBH2006584.1 aminodeoxychorismate/anthranilate synthase component II [Myxococcaceae bacterium]